MKKLNILFVSFTSLVLFLFLTHSLLDIFGVEWQILFEDLDKTERFVLFALVFCLMVSALIFVGSLLVKGSVKRVIQKNLSSLLAGGGVQQTGDLEIDSSFQSLAGKIHLLTEVIQISENQVLEKEERIVEAERKRIARDLHDTVSQELFAAHMILSGLKQQSDSLAREKMKLQLESVVGILETAQRDLRILLLHLRPIELEGKSLVAGIENLVQELREKSDLAVSFKHEVGHLPQKVEEHIFRIVQELMSNTLRHAKATRLDLYLYQTRTNLQLKVADDGVGIEQLASGDWHYGLKNIKERVQDMAGRVQVFTAPKQGFAVDIRIPLVGFMEDDDESIVD